MSIRRKISLFRLERRPALGASNSLIAPRKRATGPRCERLNLSPAGVRRPGIELTAADAAVREADHRELQTIGLLGGKACSFDSDVLPPHPPEHIFNPAQSEAYIHYVEHLVERYAGSIYWWESWHQPNVRAGWGATPSAAAYAQLLRSQHRVIQRVDPDALLAFAPLAGTDLAFIRSVLDQLEGERCFDAIAVQPYRWSDPSGNAVRNVRLEDGVSTAAMTWKEELISIAAMVDRLGYGKPELWVTETDWGTDHRTELAATSMLTVGAPSHGELVSRDHHHVEDTFASLRDDPDLDFVKTGLWFDMQEASSSPPPDAHDGPAEPRRRGTAGRLRSSSAPSPSSSSGLIPSGN